MQLGRTFIHEPALSNENTLHVLDCERASDVLETARHIGVGRCYRPHKMEQACSAPQGICMTFSTTASSLARHGAARAIDKQERHSILIPESNENFSPADNFPLPPGSQSCGN